MVTTSSHPPVSAGGPNRVSHSPVAQALQGKRVAMVSFSPYPADPRPRRAAETLLKQGMTVDFICLRDGASPKQESAEGLRIRRLSIDHKRGGILSYLYQYSAFIFLTSCLFALRSLRRRYDLVYVHNMPDVLVVSALIPKLFGAKVILDQHDPMPELMTTIYNLTEKSFAVRMMKRLEKWSIARANLVITVNVACKRIFSNRSCRPQKIGIVMNAPDDAIFGAEPPPPKLHSGDPSQPYVIMYHGSIVERNGLDLAIEALDIVRRSMPRAQLRIYGRQTPFLDKVMEDMRNRGLENNVAYLGPKSLEKLVPEISSCDLGIIPNQRSMFSEINTPTRIFEYLSLGKPVVVPRAAGILDYFDDRSLVFFELGDAQDLAAKIEYAFSHPQEIRQVLERGTRVYRDHNWPTESQRFTDLVSSLFAGKSAKQVRDAAAAGR